MNINEVKKDKSFVKIIKKYKFEILIIIFALIIGRQIGLINKVTDSKISKVENEIKFKYTQIDSSNNQITEIETEIESIKSEINKLENNIQKIKSETIN